MYQSAAIAAAAAWLACFAAWSFEIKGGTFSRYAAGVRVGSGWPADQETARPDRPGSARGAGRRRTGIITVVAGLTRACPQDTRSPSPRPAVISR